MLALLPLALSVLPGLIDLVAGHKAGRVAGTVASAVAQVTGTDDPATAAAVLADPAKAAELRTRLAEIALEAKRAKLADVANARQQTVTLAQSGSGIAWAAATISVVIVAGFFGCVVLLFMIERTWDERTANLLNVLFGALISGFVQVCNYWLGSSAGSKASGDAVRGRCQAGDDGDAESLGLVMASHGGCNSGHIPPCGECGVTSGTVFSGGHAAAAKLEVVVDPAVCGKEALRLAG
jgi:hypothetical protein